MKKLTVVIPTFNEQNTINQLLKLVLKQKMVSEVIVVDDGSTDNTLIQIPKHPKLRLVRHKGNLGKGAAIKTGIKKASGTYLITQDADLEYSPSDYPKLIKALEKKGIDFVVGNRWNANQRGYKLAQFGNWIITKMYHIIYKYNISDPYSGYKAGKTTVWRKLDLVSSGFEVEAEIVSKLAKHRFKVAQVNIKYFPRSYSEGKKIGPLDVFKGVRVLVKNFFPNTNLKLCFFWIS